MNRYEYGIDAHSEEGITIGLIDTIITVCHVLAPRDLTSSDAVKEALTDLRQDEDVVAILNGLWQRKRDSQ